MRTGNLSSLTERDWTSVREFREFARQEQEEQRLAEDRAQYEQQYLRTVEERQRRVPLVAPIPFEEWRAYTDPAISDPVLRGVQATNAALLARVRRDEAVEAEAERKQAREDVLAGKPDEHFWKIPASAAGLSMSMEEAKAFAREQGRLFVEHTPEFYPCPSNVAAITEYLTTNSVVIPNEECCRLAWLRLRELALIEQRPAPVQEPTPEPQPQPDPEELRQQKRNEYLTKIVVTDPRTGQGYTEYQLDRLPADEYKRLMIGEFRTPRITDVIKPSWYRGV